MSQKYKLQVIEYERYVKECGNDFRNYAPIKNLPEGRFSARNSNAAIFYYPSFRLASLMDRSGVYRNDLFSPACCADPWSHCYHQPGYYLLFFADLSLSDSCRNLPDLCVS